MCIFGLYQKINVMAEIISKEGSIVIDGRYSVPKGAFVAKELSGGKVKITSSCPSDSWTVDPLETTIDGASFSDSKSFIEALADFKRGSTGPGTEAVMSVTGDGVDNTDPQNPVIVASDVSDPGSLVKYSATGAVNTAYPEFPENAVPLSYLNANTQLYLGLHETLEALKTAHPVGQDGHIAAVKDIDSTGDVHRFYYWGVMAEEWLPQNKAEDDVHSITEEVTNKIWVNGKNIYRRVFHEEAIEDDGAVLISLAAIGITEITNFDYTINEGGQIRKNVSTLDVVVTNTSLTITPTEVPSVPTSVTVILEYTK